MTDERTEAPPTAIVYAVSVHDGGGSMSEGFDSIGAMGFWSDADEAAVAAKQVYDRLAAKSLYFAQEGDARVVAIEQDISIDELIEMVCKRQSWSDE